MLISSIINLDGWRPAIGDSNMAGWIITIAYFLVSYSCFRTAHGVKNLEINRKISESSTLWFGFATLLLILGINKQLDLHQLISIVGRNIAKNEGWYDRRREVQAVFIVIVTLCFFLSVAVVIFRLKSILHRYWLAFTGVVILLSFVMIRAASFHHVDYFLNMTPGFLKIKSLIELGGILIIGLAALRTINRLNEGTQSIK